MKSQKIKSYCVNCRIFDANGLNRRSSPFFPFKNAVLAPAPGQQMTTSESNSRSEVPNMLNSANR